MVKPIRGKVARVLNKHEIAINVGTAHGVAVGMYFDVIDANELDIKDPDTGEVLGSIERGKIRVKITYVQEKLSVAAAHPYLSPAQIASSGYRSSSPPLVHSLPPLCLLKLRDRAKKNLAMRRLGMPSFKSLKITRQRRAMKTRNKEDKENYATTHRTRTTRNPPLS